MLVTLFIPAGFYALRSAVRLEEAAIPTLPGGDEVIRATQTLLRQHP
jgi:hypothetical protein